MTHRLSDKADVPTVNRLVEAATPLFAGKDPAVQSAALADLTSMWLSGMFIIGDEKKTQQLRAAALGMFIASVEALTPINEAMYTRPKLEKKMQ